VTTVVPWRLSRLTRQQVRWKKSFLRNLFFTGAFYWRRGLAPSLLFYPHVVLVLATPFMAVRHLLLSPLAGEWELTLLYLSGVFLKGCIWAFAYKARNPGCSRWVYRPFMSILAAIAFSTLLLYSAITIRRNAWARG
jgi:hypothetical protein